MPSLFKLDRTKRPVVPADPASDLDYSVSSWLEGLLFTDAVWSIEPAVTDGLHAPSINLNPVVIDGVTYQPGELAITWIKNLAAGTDYVVTLRGTFTGNRIDERSFTVQCRQL